MKLNEAKDLAQNLMNYHGISNMGWRFKFDSAKRRFGCCKYRSKTITLSMYLTELNSADEVKNTILHEIAHALVGVGNGHNEVWKSKAKEIGCSGERCYNSEKVVTVKGNYEATCVGCNRVHRKYRMRSNVQSCGYCSGGRYNPTYKLNWVRV
ncbi:MAG: hypothetical protein RLZ10_714 [Bacteroidota bacterium]|jgi:predicted SprT family Zn-dependent metalloprotease